MRATKYLWFVLLIAGLAALGLSCTGDTVDDGDSADVVLNAVALERPSIEGTLDEETGSCLITVTDWSYNVEVKPKNSLAITSPFNDVILEHVRVSYTFRAPGLTAPTRTFGLGDVVIPANGSNQVTFPPMSFSDVRSAFIGESANLELVFFGRTVENEVINKITSGELQFGGDCIPIVIPPGS